MSELFLCQWDPARYPEGYLRRGCSEADVQTAVLQYLALRRVMAFPVDSGAKWMRGRASSEILRTGGNLSVLAGKTGAAAKGVCDIIGVREGRALFIEVKRPAHLGQGKRGLKQLRPAGEASDEQMQFLTEAHRHGALVGVVWSVDDMKYILDHDDPETRCI